MLAYVPRPYADELLYSVLARCSDSLGFTQHRPLIRLLTGQKGAKSKFDLPTRLDHLVSVVPGQLLGSAEDVLKRNTLFPLYSPFIDKKWRTRLTEAMLTSDPGKPRAVVGLSPLRVGCPKHLHACPQCWQDDATSGRERYWRRSHQSPGVLLCHRHGIPLILAGVRTLNPDSVQKYISAERAQRLIQVQTVLGDLNRDLLTKIAQGAYWLLNFCDIAPGPIALRDAYFRALGERALVKGKTVRLFEVNRLILENCGRGTLIALSSDIEIGATHSWITQLLRRSGSSRSAQAPLRHLILMASLGYDAESFFREAQKPAPAPQDPAPHEATIHKIHPCQVKHGDLVSWWPDPNISVCEMARRLGVAAGTVGLYAAKNGFPFPRRSNTGITGKPTLRTGRPRQWRSKDEVRETFLLLRYEFPRFSQKELSEVDGGTISWLQKHDLAWLRQNRCQIVRKGGNPGIDWAARDTACARKIGDIVRQLKKQGVTPSISAVARELGWSLGNAYKNMPNTKAALSKVLLKPGTRRNRQISR